MGVIINQSIKSSFSYYLGMIIGALNTLILYPLVFSDNPEYLGFIQIILAYSILFSSFINLGLPSIIIKFFPSINKKGQLFFFSTILSIIGFCFFSLFYYFFLEEIVYSALSQEQSSILVSEYTYYIIPLVIFISFSDVLSAVSRSYLDSSTPIFLNEVFLKAYSVIVLLLFWFGFMQVSMFISVYFIGYFVRFLILLVIQLYNRRLYFESKTWDLKLNKMIKFGVYVIFGSTSGLLISNIDMLMLAHYIDLEHVAYYTVAFYIGNAILVPARSINAISAPLLADAWKNDNIKLIGRIYYQSSINQLILGGIFLLCIWINIDNIMSILNSISPKFAGGKYVVLFIALAKLVSLISGVNSSIIINSRYYRFDLFSNIPFLIFIVTTNAILIPSDRYIMSVPISGINGAAFATLISTFLFVCIKIAFVYLKFNIQPFSIDTVKTLFLLLVVYLVISSVNININSYVNIILNSLIVLLVFIPLIYVLRISEHINSLILINIKRIKLFLS